MTHATEEPNGSAMVNDVTENEINKLQDVRDTLSQSLGREPTDKEIAESLNWTTPQVGQVKLYAEVFDIFAAFPPLEKEVLKMRFGMVDGGIKTLEEVAKELNDTREGVRQLEARAMRRLRHPRRAKRLEELLGIKLGQLSSGSVNESASD